VQAVEIYQDILGGEHPSTLTSMANLGRWDEAEKIRKAELGANLPDTLTAITTSHGRSIDNLTSVLIIKILNLSR